MLIRRMIHGLKINALYFFPITNCVYGSSCQEGDNQNWLISVGRWIFGFSLFVCQLFTHQVVGWESIVDHRMASCQFSSYLAEIKVVLNKSYSRGSLLSLNFVSGGSFPNVLTGLDH